MHSVDGLKLGVQELQRDLTLRRCLAKEAAINTLDDKISGVEELLSKHLIVVEQKQPDLEKVCTAVYPLQLSGLSHPYQPGRIAQSVTCLATDASLTVDPGVASLIPARSHTFVEIDNEIVSMVILLPSAESFKKGCCQLQANVCARSTG